MLLTRAPVASGSIATPLLPLDLHVLSLSLAFILSQDQTLRCSLSCLFFFLFEKASDLWRIRIAALEIDLRLKSFDSCSCTTLFVYCKSFKVLGLRREPKATAKLRTIFELTKFYSAF